jgi:hypothetical protein
MLSTATALTAVRVIGRVLLSLGDRVEDRCGDPFAGGLVMARLAGRSGRLRQPRFGQDRLEQFDRVA